MDIFCKRCHTPIKATEVNLDTSVAKCLACNAVFDFRDQLSEAVEKNRAPVDTPKGMEFRVTAEGFELVRKWFSKKVLGLLVFCIFWDGFMAVWFGIAIHEKQWMMAAFGTIHALVGLGLSYTLVCGFINHTHIQVSFRSINIAHRPLPWPGNKSVSVGEIKQLFSKRKVHRNKNGTSYTYEVRYMDHRGKENKLLTGLETANQALYIEQELEDTLRIKDKPVEGELAR